MANRIQIRKVGDTALLIDNREPPGLELVIEPYERLLRTIDSVGRDEANWGEGFWDTVIGRLLDDGNKRD